jgi:hypothetical protein
MLPFVVGDELSVMDRAEQDMPSRSAGQPHLLYVEVVL